MEIEICATFNKELQQQIDGTLSKGHIYKLGKPGKILQEAGVPDYPIELKASRLTNKSSADYKNKHPFQLSEIKDLPKIINNPIAIFKSTKINDNSKIILTELKNKNGYNFVAVLKLYRNESKGKIDINDIRSIYPKDRVVELLDWLESGKLVVWKDEKRATDFISTQSPYRIGGGDKIQGSINKYSK